jgi:hypothetical protein
VLYTIIYFSTYKETWVFKSSTARICKFEKEIKEEEEKKIMALINEKSLIMKGDKNKS